MKYDFIKVRDCETEESVSVTSSSTTEEPTTTTTTTTQQGGSTTTTTTTTVAPPDYIPGELMMFCINDHSGNDEDDPRFSPTGLNSGVIHHLCSDSEWFEQSFIDNTNPGNEHGDSGQFHATSVVVPSGIEWTEFKTAEITLRWTTHSRNSASLPCFEVVTTLGHELTDQEIIDAFGQDGRERLGWGTGLGIPGFGIKLMEDGSYAFH